MSPSSNLALLPVAGSTLAITGDVAAVLLAELAGAWVLLVEVRGGRRARDKGEVNGGAQVLEQHDDADMRASMRGEPQQRDAQLGAQLAQRREVAK